MLWILASVAFALLCYEIPTLITAVLMPLWSNPGALQTDFHYYFEAARRFSAGGPLYLASDDVIAGFAYPPPAIVPFVALSKLPLGAALLLFTLGSYAALLIAARLWLTYLRRQGMVIAMSTEVAVTAIAVALGPSYMNAMIGQVNAFVLLTAVAFIALAPRAARTAGFLLASGIWLKVYPIVLVAVGAWDRRTWRALGWAAAAAIAIAIGLLVVVPFDAYRSFFFDVLPSRIDKTAIHITNQSLVAFLERFRFPHELFLNWTGQQAVTVSFAIRAANLLFGAAAIGGVWWRSLRRPSSDPSSTAVLIALIAVIAPLGWGHTYVMVLPLVMLQLLAMPGARPIASTLIVICVAALMIPAGRHLPIDSAPDWIQNLIYSRYLLATVALCLLKLDSHPREA